VIDGRYLDEQDLLKLGFLLVSLRLRWLALLFRSMGPWLVSKCIQTKTPWQPCPSHSHSKNRNPTFNEYAVVSLHLSTLFLPSWIQDLSQFELQFDGQITLSRIICATLTRCLARMQLREDAVWSVWSYSCFYCGDWGSRGVRRSSSCKRLAKRIGIRRSACRTYLHKGQQSPWLKKRNECQCQWMPSMLWHAGSVKAERIWTFQTIQIKAFKGWILVLNMCITSKVRCPEILAWSCSVSDNVA
jgi:hypothetical protein